LSGEEKAGDAVDVGEDGGGVFGEFEGNGPNPGPRIGRRGTGTVGDGDGAEVVGLSAGLGRRVDGDLAAEAGTALLDVEVVVVEAEVLAAEGDGGALTSGAEDVSAEQLHG